MLNWRQLKNERALCGGPETCAERSRLSCIAFASTAYSTILAAAVSSRCEIGYSASRGNGARLLHTLSATMMSESAHPPAERPARWALFVCCKIVQYGRG